MSHFVVRNIEELRTALTSALRRAPSESDEPLGRLERPIKRFFRRLLCLLGWHTGPYLYLDCDAKPHGWRCGLCGNALRPKVRPK